MSEIFVVLSPGYANADGHFASYETDGSYIGGQLRMNAAVELVRNYPGSVFLLVGGCDVEAAGTLHSRKTRQMSRFIHKALQEEGPDVRRHIYEVTSLPCTYHNFVAILHNLSANTRLMESGTVKVHVLTNAYHIPRSRLHAQQALDDVLAKNQTIQATIEFMWHAAENVMNLPLSSIEKEDPEAYKKRLRGEDKGLLAIKSGLYYDSCLKKYKSMLTPLLMCHGKDLLAEHEYKAWGIDGIPHALKSDTAT